IAVAQGLLLGDEEIALQGLGTARGLLTLEQRRAKKHQETGDEGDDAHDDQQLDQREAGAVPRSVLTSRAHWRIPCRAVVVLPFVSFPGSAWERTVSKLCFEAANRTEPTFPPGMSVRRSRASRQCVPKQSLGTRERGSAGAIAP